MSQIVPIRTNGQFARLPESLGGSFPEERCRKFRRCFHGVTPGPKIFALTCVPSVLFVSNLLPHDRFLKSDGCPPAWDPPGLNAGPAHRLSSAISPRAGHGRLDPIGGGSSANTVRCHGAPHAKTMYNPITTGVLTPARARRARCRPRRSRSIPQSSVRGHRLDPSRSRHGKPICFAVRIQQRYQWFPAWQF